MFLEDTGTSEGEGIMDAAGMANSVVRNNKWIQEGNKLGKGQIMTGQINMKTHLAVQRVVPILVKPSVTMEAWPLE